MTVPTLCTHLRFADTELEVFRCDTDGGVVFQHPDLLRVHAGHKFKQPVLLKDGEEEQVFLLWNTLHLANQK